VTARASDSCLILDCVRVINFLVFLIIINYARQTVLVGEPREIMLSDVFVYSWNAVRSSETWWRSLTQHSLSPSTCVPMSQQR